MSHDAQALGHRMPLKRIDMDPVWSVDPNQEIARPYLDKIESDRIWRITRQVSEGCNPPMGEVDAISDA